MKFRTKGVDKGDRSCGGGPYLLAGKIVIDWLPDFVAVAKRHVAAQVWSGRVGALAAYALQPDDVASDGLGAGAGC